MMRYYNQRVKLKQFNPRDMVLRKVSQATKDLNNGKLGPNWEGPYKVIRYSRRGSYYLEDKKESLCLVHGMLKILRSTISKGAKPQP